jgi:O-antigen ligase
LDRPKIAAALVFAGLAGHAFFVPISIAGMQIALAVAALGLLLDLPRPARTPLDLPILALVLVAVASDLLSPYGPPGLAEATLWRSAVGFFVVAHGLRVLAPGAAIRVLYFTCAGLAISAVVGLVQYRSGVDLVHLLHLRSGAALVDAPGVPERFGAMGFFTSRLSFGHNASVLVALLLGALASGAVPRARVPLVAGAAVLGLSAVAVTFDRAAWLALGAAAVVVTAFAAPSVRRALLPALGILVLLAAFHGGIRERFQSSFSAGANRDRVFIWSRSLEIIRDHPLRGVGFANYPRICGRYYDRVDPKFFMRTWAHNLELTTLAETGPLGLAAMLWLFGAAAVALYRRMGPGKLALGGLAALAALFVIAQVHDVFFDTKVMYALWLALGLSLSPGPSASRGWPLARVV